MDYKWQYKIRSKQLNKIMEKLEGKVRLDGYTLILPDDYLTKEDIKGLSKKFYEYANNVFVSHKFEGDIKREEEQKRLQRQRDYSMIPEASKVEFKKLFDCGEAVATDGDKHKFTEGEIKSIEFGYIKLLQPKGNVAGRVREFIY